MQNTKYGARHALRIPHEPLIVTLEHGKAAKKKQTSRITLGVSFFYFFVFVKAGG